MNTIQEIKAEKQNRFNRAMDECGVFFAFSNQQFEEGKTPLEEGDKYVSLGAGGYMPKSKVKDWLQKTAEIEKWFKKAVKDCKGARRALIAYELANHEAYYTGSIEDALRALGAGYTEKEVWAVYNEELKKQEAA